MDKAVFLGLNALGDFLCTTPTLRAFRRQHPRTKIIYLAQSAGFTRVLEHNPDIDLVIYSDRLFVQGLPDQLTTWLRSMPLDLRAPATFYHLDLKFVCKSQDDFKQHMSQAFAKMVGVQIESTRPTVVLTESDRRGARVFTDRPYVVFSMHSVSNPERADGKGRKKDWPTERWQEVAKRIAALGEYEILTIGAESESPYPVSKARVLYGLPIRVVAALLEGAACVVTLENGIAHLSSAVDARSVVIYSDMMPLEWASYAETPRSRVLFRRPVRYDLRSSV